MKHPLRYSITGFLVATLAVAIAMTFIAGPESGLEEYKGVWDVIHGVDNTAATQMHNTQIGMGGLVATRLVDTDGAELVITDDRLFFVNSFLGTSSYEIIDFTLGTETLIELRELRSGRECRLILSRSDSELTFAFTDNETDSIDQSSTGNQIIYTAKHLLPDNGHAR